MRDGRWRFYGVVALAAIATLLLLAHAIHEGRRRTGALTGELTQTDRPTAADIVAVLGPSFDEPDLLVATESSERSSSDFIAWKLRYDGIDLEFDLRSSLLGGAWTSRWHPVTSSPPRWHHGEELSDEAARVHAHVAADATVRHVYHGKLKNTWKGGAQTAENSFYVFDGFTPAMEVMGSDGRGALIDAYSGDLIEKRSNWID